MSNCTYNLVCYTITGLPGVQYFDRSVNSISTKGDRLRPPNNIGTPGFTDLPTALKMAEVIQLLGY